MDGFLVCPSCKFILKPALDLPVGGTFAATCTRCGHKFAFKALSSTPAPSLVAAKLQAPVTSVSFSINGTDYTVANPDPTLSLNEFIRSQPGLTGTKRMCAEGGCGACVVALTIPETSSEPTKTIAINSCLRPLCSVDGYQITTTEGLGSRKDGFHPIQDRIAAFNGTQCGFCTPGMVMNMYSLLASNPRPTRQQVEDAFSGHICRCTGYTPILNAMKSFAIDATESESKGFAPIDIEDLVCVKGKSHEHSKDHKKACTGTCASCPSSSLCHSGAGGHAHSPKPVALRGDTAAASSSAWYSPSSLSETLALINSLSPYRLVVGNTSTGIFKDQPSDNLIDISRIPELTTVSSTSSSVSFGAAVSLNQIVATLSTLTATVPSFQTLVSHILLIANVSVRNIGSWAGNLMMTHDNADFPSDMFTILEGVGATVSIMSTLGTVSVSLRDFLATNMKGRVLVSATIPFPPAGAVFSSFKIMPRHQNAHAYVNAAFYGVVDPSTLAFQAAPRIVFGGIGPYAVRASATESFLSGRSLATDGVFQQALSVLSSELTPDTPPAAASPAYRKTLALGLFYKYVLQILKGLVNPRYASAAQTFVRPISSSQESYDSDPAEYPVSKPMQKLEASIQASGEAQYVDDIPTPAGGLHAAFVLSAFGNADIDSIDASAALSAPGVVRFLSAADIPGSNNFAVGGVEPIFAANSVVYAGQSIGLVVADTQAHANAAASLVKVNYKNIRKPVLTIQDAIAAGQVQPSGIPALVMGNVASAFASSYKVLQGTVECGSQAHFHMENHAALVTPTDDGGFHVHSATQWIDNVQNAIAQSTNVPAHKITVEVKRLGGAYGGKITRPALPASAVAVAASILRRPVRIALTLNANMELIGKRNPFLVNYKVGVNQSGVLTAVQLDYYADTGCFVTDTPGTVSMAMTTCDNAYYAPNWLVNGYMCVTNTPSNTAARAPGCVPAIFFMESVVDHVARALQLDPAFVREANLNQVGQMTPYGQPLEYCSVGSLWSSLKASADYSNRAAAAAAFNANNRWVKKGIHMMPLKYGISWGSYSCGATVNVYADGTVAVTHSGVEVGQGINTKIAQIAAYTLGIDISKVSIRQSSSEKVPNAQATGGSITSELNGQAVILACQQLLTRMGPVKQQLTNPTWEETVTACIQQGVELATRGWLFPLTQYTFQYFSYGAVCTEVQVDILTGETQILRTDILFDCGVSLNPLIDLGQTEGGFLMGIGYFLTEKVMYDETSGALLSNGTWEYKPPASKDIPIDLRVSLLKNAPNPSGILRSKASGEPPTCMSCSVLFAVKDAIASARKDTGNTDFFVASAPLTVDETQTLCLVDPSKQFAIV